MLIYAVGLRELIQQLPSKSDEVRLILCVRVSVKFNYLSVVNILKLYLLNLRPSETTASLFVSTTLQKWPLILLPSYPTTFTDTWLWTCWTLYCAVKIYLFQFNNGNTRTVREICSKLTILTGKNCVLLNSLQEWLLGRFWSCSYIYIIS